MAPHNSQTPTEKPNEVLKEAFETKKAPYNLWQALCSLFIPAILFCALDYVAKLCGNSIPQ